MRSSICQVRGSVGAVVILAAVSAAGCGAGREENVDEQRLGRKPAGQILNVVKSATSEGCRLGLVVAIGGKQHVVVDGQPGPEFDRIGEGDPVFSADGKRVAYVAKKGDKWLVVVDGQPGPEFDAIMEGSPVFSADGKRVAYSAEKRGKWLVVVDGQPGPLFDGIRKGDPVFSADGKRVAYAAKKGDKWLVVVEGQPGPKFDAVPVGPVFLKDGTAQYISGKGDALFRVDHRP